MIKLLLLSFSVVTDDDIFGSTRSPTICTKLIAKGSQLADGFYGSGLNFGILMTNGYHKMTQNDTL